MPTVFFDTNALYIAGYRDSFTAGSLTADVTPIGIGIRVLHGSEYLVNDKWVNYTHEDGSGFASADDLMAYLTAQFAMRRPVGEIFGVPVVAGTDLIQGQPVAVSRASGQLLPARADTYTLAFVAGVASADTAQGFASQPAHGAITLPDWSALTGAISLNVGELYFVGPEGGLTASPRLDTQCVARVGLATSPQTLVVEPSTPIIL
ncbi:hypothetical protein ACQKQD_18610 [Methylobacterium sp. NPDC080182]|uniref:hypothetical protein n=1 Tax=Methylobacterium sp. NPDC080182 TaxID=3390590 RepID=UPI003CFF71C9